MRQRPDQRSPGDGRCRRRQWAEIDRLRRGGILVAVGATLLLAACGDRQAAVTPTATIPARETEAPVVATRTPTVTPARTPTRVPFPEATAPPLIIPTFPPAGTPIVPVDRSAPTFAAPTVPPPIIPTIAIPTIAPPPTPPPILPGQPSFGG